MKKLTAIITGALTVLAISATAFAANLISAEEARAIAQKQVPTGSTYLHTEAELQKLQPYYEVKFFDTATQTKYEIDVYQVNGKIKEYNMERKALGGSANVILSKDDVKAIVAKEVGDVSIYELKLDREHGLYEYEVKFSASGLRGEMNVNPETSVVLDKEVKYSF